MVIGIEIAQRMQIEKTMYVTRYTHWVNAYYRLAQTSALGNYGKYLGNKGDLDGPRTTIPAREEQNMACESQKKRMPGYTFYWLS